MAVPAAAILLLGIVVLLLASGGTREGFLRWAGHALVWSEPPVKADAIVVLGGDFWGPRVIAAAELARQGYAPRVLVSGPPYVMNAGRGPTVIESDLAIDFLVRKGYDRKLFLSCPNQATSTATEAVALRPALRALGAHRVLLVTSNYHSRRAGLIFRLLLPGFDIIPIGCAEPFFDPDRWWLSERGRETGILEWEKMAWNLGFQVWATKFTQLLSTSD